MDPLTHGLAGAVIWRLGLKRKHALPVAVISAMAADFDFITRLWGVEPFLRYHRGITHGVLALFLFPYVIALVFGLRKGFIYFYSVAFAGYASHILLDLTNQYGIMLFSPLEWRRYALDLTFIIDPYISAGLLFSVLIAWRWKKKAATAALAALLLLASYVGVRYYFHEKTESFVRQKIDAYNYGVYPLPNDFMRWWFVVGGKNEEITGFADLFTERLYVDGRYGKEDGDRFVEASKAAAVARDFLDFARHPHAEVKRKGNEVEVVWRELSYAFLPGEHFTARVVMDEKGNVKKTGFKF